MTKGRKISQCKARVAGLFVVSAALATAVQPAQATSVQTLAKAKESSLVSLGKAPEKEKIVLSLGSLRTGEAELPPVELTLAERNQMRVRMAASLEDAVSRARRERLANRNAPAGQTPQGVPVPSDEDDEGERQDSYGDDNGGDVPRPGDIADDEGDGGDVGGDDFAGDKSSDDSASDDEGGSEEFDVAESDDEEGDEDGAGAPPSFE